ncbi:MAG: hypothetical protein M3T96_11600 [Acidobacteriota bacterium]|nr:hypothetical protein [Acidobacteriota bacterium]
MDFVDDATKKVGEYGDKAGSVLDAAQGGQKTGTAAADSKADYFVTYQPDVALSDLQTKGTIAVGPDADGSKKPNPINDSLTEFIHFSQVHADSGNKFAHNKFDPKEEKIPNGHAVMMRDGLQREAILMFAYISSCKVALIDTTKDQGALEQVGAMASNLLGGGNKTAKPDPKQLDTFLDDLKTEADKLKSDPINYKDIHDAGKKFHETRNTYRAFCKSLDDFYLKPPKSEGIGAISDAVGSAAANLPGVGKIMGVVQRITFKMFDLYLATFLELRKDHERQIELGAHQLTIDAIKKNYENFLPSYPVWFVKQLTGDEEKKKADDEQKAKDADKLENKMKGDGLGLISDVAKPVDDAKETVSSTLNDIYNFAGGNGNPPDPTPGTDALTKIFSQMKGDKKETDLNSPPTASDSIYAGLNATLTDIGGVPAFFKPIIRELTNANLGMLEDIFKRIMSKSLSGEIQAQALLDSGRYYLTQTITSMGTKWAMGMLGDSLPNYSNEVQGEKVSAKKSEDDFAVGAGGKNISPKQLLAKQMNELLGKYAEPIISYMVGDLATQLEASRKKAEEENALTMEVLLGRLPWLVSITFRNTFFPMFNLVAEEVVGKVAPPIKSALEEVNKKFKDAQKKVDTVEDYNRRVQLVQAALNKLRDDADAVHIGTDPAGLADLSKLQTDVENAIASAIYPSDKAVLKDLQRKLDEEKAKKDQDAMNKFYSEDKLHKDEKFPVTGRTAAATGIKVEKEEESVLKINPAGDANQTAGNSPAASPIPSMPSAPALPSF